uniref:L-sorbosone dehydrogenase n=1 Tax=uncultured Microgenomates bacterium Rifle_16ft_4_minimus_37906 TaxID=1665116 RepID=A0A0H4TQX3_9BACT|nr:L-sorbosone dehydrogenase [uncultured Microgenomates bacterium Rifle_16ft_4_minimus_37906]
MGLMRRILLIVFLILGLVGAGIYFTGKYQAWRLNPKELFTNLTTPQKNIRQFLPQGQELSYPLTIAKGFGIGVFADLKGGMPRVLAFDPNGVLFASVPNKGKVVALPDKERDGSSDQTIDVLSGLNQPHGITFDADKLYVAESDKVVRYSYDPNSFSATNREVLFSLPGGGRHTTRTIRIFGDKLYTSVGSSCDTCIEDNSYRASVLVSDLNGSGLRVFAKGLRNTVFFTFDNQGRIWGTDMGRDFLGDNLPPDDVNLIEDGKDYGWPYCYGQKVRDSKFKPGEKLSYCTDTVPPKFELPAHVAPLGIAFIESALFPPGDQGSLLVALHGSWNSSTPVGYKIVKLSVFADDIGGMTDFVSGFLLDGKEVLGRPVDLIFNQQGLLFISDDKAGLIYILSKN